MLPRHLTKMTFLWSRNYRLFSLSNNLLITFSIYQLCIQQMSEHGEKCPHTLQLVPNVSFNQFEKNKKQMLYNNVIQRKAKKPHVCFTNSNNCSYYLISAKLNPPAA